MKSVTKAVSDRFSARKFTNKNVSSALLKKLILQASQAPSGGNLQPWRIYAINNNGMKKFLDFQSNWTGVDEPAYDIYPQKLKEPYRTSRYKVGEMMYELLKIPREDKASRINQVLENFNFFGAPAALFCFIDKKMGPPQWSDCGMFLQTFMLLAQESGLDTCAQEAWSIKEKSIKFFFDIPDELGIFCGMAVGYADKTAPINKLKTHREPFDIWAQIID
ncbi:nitroreductase [Gammaproteobacteria bacterium]|nr:nitroreductase [Gammaproteobacteria bacterium]MDA8798897.1 nitroreductase [Gammaproteobacteria bacterium]MDC0919408.1 nitroreductase [Gammaproteobacteria bacterium]